MSSALILFGFIRSLLNRDKILYGNWDSKTTEAFYEHDMLINWGELSYKRLFFNLDMHPSYYALFSTIAILVLLFTHFIDIKKSFKWVLVVLHTVMIILVSSKAGLVSLFVIFILAFFFDTEIKQRLILASAVLIIVISSLSVPSTQLRIKRAYQSMLSDGTEILDSSSAERITLWKSLEYYSVSELLLGTGIQTSRTKTKSYTGIDKNMHNQFLQSLVSSGIIGLLLLICFLLSPLLYNRGPFIYVFILVVVLNLTLENMFDRVWGVVFISFFYGLFIFGDLNFSLKKPLEIEN
jgi:O-antigen ligase